MIPSSAQRMKDLAVIFLQDDSSVRPGAPANPRRVVRYPNESVTVRLKPGGTANCFVPVFGAIIFLCFIN